MICLKRILLVVLVAVLGFFSWSYFLGGLKMKRDYQAFAEAMETCTQIYQNWIFNGYPFNRLVKGVEGEICVVHMSTASPQMLACKFPMSDMSLLAESFAKQADNIDLIGVTRLHIDINSEDPFFVAMNSDACQVVDPA